MRSRRLSCTLLALTLGGTLTAQSLQPSLSVTLSRVDNISRTSDVATRRDATTYEATLAASHHRQLTRAWSVTTGGELSTFQEPDFDRNAFTTLAGRLAFQRKAGLGPLAPVVSIESALAYQDTRYASHRGMTVESGLRISKRITPSLRTSAGVQWREHFARTQTFDTHQRSASLEATWDFAERWSLAGSLRTVEGRFLTHAGPAAWARALGGSLGPAVARVYASIPSEVTGLYGPNWITYRPKAHATTGSASLLFAFTDRASAELQGSLTSMTNEADVHYPTQALSLRLGYRF
ncbi:MAG: hypothetical protein U1F61_30845 [Opitutaceae bacterium]